MWIAYVLGLSNSAFSRLTIKEFINMWHAYIWKQQQTENMIASLVTIWIANSVPRKNNKAIKLDEIITDGRFDKILTDSDREVYEDLFGRR